MAAKKKQSAAAPFAHADEHDIELRKATDRINFGSIREPISVPDLLGVQTNSFDCLLVN